MTLTYRGVQYVSFSSSVKAKHSNVMGFYRGAQYTVSAPQEQPQQNLNVLPLMVYRGIKLNQQSEVSPAKRQYFPNNRVAA